MKMPGNIPEGYGQGAESSKFYGSTIFHDAASKIIHIEDQVTLAAGEMVMTNERFEERLWEQLAVLT